MFFGAWRRWGKVCDGAKWAGQDKFGFGIDFSHIWEFLDFFFCSFNFWNQSGWGQAFKFQPGGPWGSPKLDKGCWLEKAASWTASRSLPFFLTICALPKENSVPKLVDSMGGLATSLFPASPSVPASQLDLQWQGGGVVKRRPGLNCLSYYFSMES